ncbi:MAG: hypothetical protein OXI83_16035, partial [Gemmatimonadota bacterium]|nr:hypothetical protein [Gemmatimonadota bacterium]
MSRRGRGHGGRKHSGGPPTARRSWGRTLGAVFQSYRILFVIYGVGIAIGAREFYQSRVGEPVDWGSDRWADMTEVVRQVNPQDPDTDFLEGVQSIVRGEEGDFVTHFEDALDAGVKHNEFLLRDYAQHLLASGGDWRQVNEAVNSWRENYPFSNETLTLEMGSGPRSQADISILNRELRAVPWIGDVELEPYEAGGRQAWRVHITFRPPRPIDLRDAVAAESILSLPEADRRRNSVTCTTM